MELTWFHIKKVEKYEQSEAAYERALKLNPQHKGALEYMGELYITLGENIKAKELLTRLKKVCPSDARSWMLLKKHMQQSTQTNIGGNLLNGL